MESIFFECNDNFLASIEALHSHLSSEEKEIYESIKKKKSQNKLRDVKEKLALTIGIEIDDLKRYLYQLEDKRFISIDEIEYQKTRSQLKEFKLMLEVTLEEIISLFSEQSGLAMFLVKVMKYCTEQQKTESLKHEFKIMKDENGIIIFYVFALHYSIESNKSSFGIWNRKKELCNFEKLSCTICTTMEECNKFEKKYCSSSAQKIREQFIKDCVSLVHTSI